MKALPRSRSRRNQSISDGHAASPGKALQLDESRFAMGDDALPKSKYSIPVKFNEVKFAMTSGVNCLDSNEK